MILICKILFLWVSTKEDASGTRRESWDEDEKGQWTKANLLKYNCKHAKICASKFMIGTLISSTSEIIRSALPHDVPSHTKCSHSSARCSRILGSPRPARIGISLKWILLFSRMGFLRSFLLSSAPSFARAKECENFAEFHEVWKKYLYWNENKKKSFRSINQKPIKLLAYLCKIKSYRARRVREKRKRGEIELGWWSAAETFMAIVAVGWRHESSMRNITLSHKIPNARSCERAHRSHVKRKRLACCWTLCDRLRERSGKCKTKKAWNEAINLAMDQLITSVYSNTWWLSGYRWGQTVINLKWAPILWSLDTRYGCWTRKYVTIRVKISYNRREGKPTKHRVNIMRKLF